MVLSKLPLHRRINVKNHSEILIKCQKLSGLTKSQFAKKCGVSRAAFYLWLEKNFVPEKRRGKIAELSKGQVRPEDFDFNFRGEE